MASKRGQPINKKPSINEAIVAQELRVIDEEGRSIGVLSKQEALQLAREKELDLIVVGSKSEPPTAKIIDWGKYNYQKQKRQQQNRQTSSSKSINLKQMRFSIKISDYDLDVKLRKVNKFLQEGHKVRLTIILKGREIIHRDLALEMAHKIVDKLGNNGMLEQEPKLNGRQVNMIIRGK